MIEQVLYNIVNRNHLSFISVKFDFLIFLNSSKDRTDYDVIKENYQFLWDDDDDDNEITWGKRLAKKYWDKLFKEYTICDLSRYKEKKIAFRWRTEKEVMILILCLIYFDSTVDCGA